MNLLLAGQTFTDKLIHAFCWTLIHSLWQGMLLALFAGIVILTTKRSAPALRYRLLSGLFLVFVAAVCVSFAWQWQAGAETADPLQQVFTRENGYLQNGHLQNGSRQAAAPGFGRQAHYIAPLTGPLPVNISRDRSLFATASSIKLSFFDRFAAYCNSHAYLVVMIWFVLFSVRCLKILANIGTMQRLRHTGIQAPPAYWKSRIKVLAERLHIKRQVELLESEIAKVPMMAGFLKPVILIPIGLLAQLPADQVEAVLLHELAHIRRKDYLVNILQHFAEIIFFFNPGVLWLSSLLRDEREHCCDDMAIGETNNKQQFIDALISFQEYRLSGSSYAMGFPGSQKGYLLQRVKRIIYNDNKGLDIREKIFLVACLFITGVLTLAFSQSGKAVFGGPVVPGKTGVFAHGGVDTIPRKNSSNGTIGGGSGAANEFAFVEDWDGRKEGVKRSRSGDTVTYYSRGYEIVTMDSTLKALFYHGLRIPDEKIVDYTDIINQIILEKNIQAVQPVEPGMSQAEWDRQQSELDEQLAVADKRQADFDKQLADANRAQAEYDLRNTNGDQAAPVPPVPAPPVPSVSVGVPPVSALTLDSSPTPMFYPRFRLAETIPGGSNGGILQPNDLQVGGDTLPDANDKRLEEIREYRRRLQEQRAQLDRQQQQLNEEYRRLGEEADRLSVQSIPPLQDINPYEQELSELTRAGDLADSAQREKIEATMKIIYEKNTQRRERIDAFMKRQDVSPEAKEEFIKREQEEMGRMDENVRRMNENMLRRRQDWKPLQPRKPVQPMKPLYAPRVAIKPFVLPIVKSVIADLQAEKIITDTLDLSFTLNADVLIVNGVQQSGKLHRKFNEKYIKTPDGSMIYSRKGSTINSTTHNIKTW